MSALGLPRSLHSGNAGFIFFGLSNQFVDQAVNAVRQKLDRLESLFVGFGKVNDVSVNRFVARKATGFKDRSLQIVDVERCDFIGKLALPGRRWLTSLSAAIRSMAHAARGEFP